MVCCYPPVRRADSSGGSAGDWTGGGGGGGDGRSSGDGGNGATNSDLGNSSSEATTYVANARLQTGTEEGGRRVGLSPSRLDTTSPREWNGTIVVPRPRRRGRTALP